MCVIYPCTHKTKNVVVVESKIRSLPVQTHEKYVQICVAHLNARNNNNNNNSNNNDDGVCITFI